MNEVKLIDLIVERLGTAGTDARIKIGPGDDAAVVTWETDQELVVSTDVCLDGVHVPRDCPGDLVGYRSVAMSVADIVAMGAIPQYLTIALNIEQAEVEWITDFADGVRVGCEIAGTVVIGGNLAKGTKQITVTVIGCVPQGQSIQRNTAQPEDDVWVTGTLGASVLAVPAIATWVPPGLSDLRPRTSTDVFARYMLPPIRTNFVSCLRDYATACTDISDGLSFELEQLIIGSPHGFTIDTDELPLWPNTILKDVLARDDSYEMLFTASKDKREVVLNYAKQSKTPVSRIGHIRSTSERIFTPQCDVDSVGTGFSHF